MKLPEGFAFYALYPEQYVAAALRWMADHRAASRRVVVVGIRSIGTTLLAVVAAALRAGGWEAHRRTVRPSGHPFARQADIRAEALEGATWGLVVDEGPGLSGSSLAAAAEALAAAGLDPARISFLPGHAGEPGGAASGGVRAWWSRAPRYVTPSGDLRWEGRSLPENLAARTLDLWGVPGPVPQIEDLGGGLWRNLVYPHPARWPAVCAPFERPKYRCAGPGGAAVLWKFAGLAGAPGGAGSLAEAARARLAERAQAGWTPAPLGVALGFVATPWAEGAPLTCNGADPAVLAHIGRYLVAVAGPPLPAGEQDAALGRLREMLYWNTWEALGEAAAARTRPWGEAAAHSGQEGAPRTYGDGRLAPHEWLRTRSGQLLKVDAAGHDADHTIIGRQPLAWDVAGALVEWGLDEGAAAPLLAAYQAAGGPALRPAPLRFYRMAYAAFRTGQCALCADMLAHDPDEQARLRRAWARYRNELAGLLEDDDRSAARMG